MQSRHGNRQPQAQEHSTAVQPENSSAKEKHYEKNNSPPAIAHIVIPQLPPLLITDVLRLQNQHRSRTISAASTPQEQGTAHSWQ
jgi:hypothetical protein